MNNLFDMLNPRNNQRVKGAITIFLLLLMTPFVTIAFALLELGRYENTVLQLDEAMGVSTMSLLANYDKYLQDRFGLYACTQSQDLNSLYQVYMEENLNGLRFTTSAIKGTSVTGIYSLGSNNGDVLRKQIDEYMMLNGPQTMISEIFNLSSLLGCFDQLDSLGKLLKIAGNGVDTANDALDIAQSAEDMKNLSDEITNLIPTYNTDYDNFKNSVNAMLTKAATPRPTDPPSNASDDEKKAVATQQAEYDKAIATLAATASSKKDTYSSTIQSIIDKLESFNTKMSEFESAKDKIVKDAGSFASNYASNYYATQNKAREAEIEATLKKMDDENSDEYLNLTKELQDLKDQDAEYKTNSKVVSATSNYASSMSQVGNGYDSALLQTRIDSLKALKTTIDDLDVTTITSSLDDSIYHGVTIDGYLTSDELDAYFENSADDVAKSSLISFLKGIGNFFKGMVKCSGLYDASKCATINREYYDDKLADFTYPNGGVTIDKIINDILDIFDDCNNLEDDLSLLPEHPIKFLVSFFGHLVDIFTDIIQTIEDINNFATSFIERIQYVIDNPVSVINAGCYAGYNMSCRTGDPLIGKMDDKAKPTPGVLSGSGIPLVSDLAALIRSAYSFKEGGTDYSFYGCELEYIIFGTNSEVGNQVMAFGALYIMRLLLDIIPIMLDEEVEAMASAAVAAAGVGEIVVYLIEIFCEPLVDTLLLVNSVDVPLIKSTIYLTPAGIPSLIEAFISVSLTKAEKEALISEAYDAYKVPEGDRKAITDQRASSPSKTGFAKWVGGFLNMNYRDHLFIYLILLTATDPLTIYNRIANVVLMEETQYYKNVYGSDFEFSLDRAYTFVETSTTVSFNPILSGNNNYSNNDSSFFTIDRAIYRGY